LKPGLRAKRNNEVKFARALRFALRRFLNWLNNHNHLRRNVRNSHAQRANRCWPGAISVSASRGAGQKNKSQPIFLSHIFLSHIFLSG
jgi:hypothetical protein